MTLRRLLALPVALAAGLALAGPAQAMMFEVNDIGDGPADACDTSCTLRDAITLANSTGGDDDIDFNISTGSAPYTITPTSALPSVTEAVDIDGTTQPDFSPPARAIEIDGTGLPDDTLGLHLAAGSGGSTIRGLAVNSFANPLDNSVGIEVESNGNTIVGNYVGTNPAGSAADANTIGVQLRGDGNTVGSTTAGDANVLSGNVNFGLSVNGGNTNVVVGNAIGVGADGDTAVGNGTGVTVQGATVATGNVIGGVGGGERNVISANSTGVYIDGAASGTDLRGNLMGTNATETLARPNTLWGVLIENGTGTTVANNLIANSGTTGIRVSTGSGSGNSFTQNRIRDTGGLGIDLAKSGDGNNVVTANDTDDGDSGPNGLQNFPVITSVTVSGSSATISGTLNSTPNTSITLEGFKNSSCNPSGNGEGATTLGSYGVTTDGDGNASISNVPLPGGVVVGDQITATATATSGPNIGSTSEFSACRTAGAASPPSPPSSASLALTLAADDKTPEPGNPFSYTVTLANLGPGTAVSPQVRVTLPPGVQFISAMIAQSSGCSAAGRVVTCSYSNLANGGVARRRIRVRPTQSGTLVATAVASSSTSDPSGATASESVQAKLPKPTVAKQVNVKEVSGTVRIKQPGGSFRNLDGQDRIRTGSVIDTTRGRVRLTSAAGGGKTQTAEFFDGIFKVTQTKGKKPITDLTLVGKLVGCSSRKASAAARKRKGRRLWGSGKGRFRTRGKRSSALVRGTIWLVEDRCNGTTFTQVRRGRVLVRDFTRKRNVTVRAGRTYTAPGKR